MSFSLIKGQDRPIAMLKRYLEQDRLSGGYLFCGPQGVGKKMAAVILAKAMNCGNGGTDACGGCPSCLKIDKGQHPDVRVIGSDGSQIQIDIVRSLQREASLRPYEGARKFFIMDNAHNLTPDAANSLLKVLEEPPRSSLIILISDKPNLMFKTIISRCKIVKFSALSRPEAREMIKNEWGLDHNRAHYLSYFSEGSLGAALNLKDRDIFSEKNTVIDKLALSPAGRGPELTFGERNDLRRALNILAAWFRDIYLAKAGAPETEFINYDRRKEVSGSAAGFTFAELDRIMAALSESALLLGRNLNTKLLLHNLRAQIWKS